jgi:IS5 family transposase
VFADRGYRGKTQYKSTKVHVPKPDKNISRTKRKKHSRRAAIEPVIGHLKSNYRLCRNYLKGVLGDMMNAILAAAAMNFKRAMNLWRTEALRSWQLAYTFLLSGYSIFLSQKSKVTF